MRASDLQHLCTSPAAGEKGACRFYIWGVAETAATGAAVASDNAHFIQAKPIICLPAEVGAADMEALIKLKLGEDLVVYPADREMPAISFVIATLFHRYACGKPN